MVTLAKGKQNVSACIFDVVMSCACALEPRIYNDCGNWSGPSTGLDPGPVRFWSPKSSSFSGRDSIVVEEAAKNLLSQPQV